MANKGLSSTYKRIYYLASSNARYSIPSRQITGHCRIGCRDVVGYGLNGSYNYKDDPLFPFPAIRFKENSPDIIALREKEKGDWKLLSIAEKKCLYRASFCSTFAEFQALTGQWKHCLGVMLALVGCAFWWQIFMRTFVLPPLPITLTEEGQRHQLRRIIDLRIGAVSGIASKWDYKQDCWKKDSKDLD